MSNNALLEERLVAMEVAIAQLQQQLQQMQPTQMQSANWLEQVTGSFEDEPAFDEVIAYGQAIRKGDDSLLGGSIFEGHV